MLAPVPAGVREISPFSRERAGGLSPMSLIDLCYSGAYGKDRLKPRLYGQGGVFAYLGTKEMRRVELRALEQDGILRPPTRLPGARLRWLEADGKALADELNAWQLPSPAR